MEFLSHLRVVDITDERGMRAGADWRDAWKPMIEAIGTDFSPEEPTLLPDPLDATAIRRLLEPLEFDCPLHYDPWSENGNAVSVGPGRVVATMPRRS